MVIQYLYYIFPNFSMDSVEFSPIQTATMISDSRKTRILRIAILMVIGTTITLALGTAPYYNRYADESVGNFELFMFTITYVIPVLMTIIIILFIFYMRSKYEDWDYYMEELMETNEELKNRLNIPKEEDEMPVDFQIEKHMKKYR